MSAVVTPLPKVVGHAEWQAAREALLVKEKRATRALNALAAERRRLRSAPVNGEERAS